MRRKKTDDTPKITALYERLSREDNNEGESCSIQNQKTKLEAYVADHGFENPVHYTDDGFSGRDFNRPAWKRLMEDVEAGKVSTIIAKDMSRVGRNYLEVGHFTEIVFPRKGVRFIAIDSGVDSENPETSEFAPILNLVNEWYVKDHSEKVRMSYRARSAAGEHLATCPLYGYRKDPDHKGHWLIDPEAAEVVRTMFRLAAGGKTPGQIAKMLYDNQIESPACHLARLYPKRKMPEMPCHWLGNTVRTYLSSREYIGTMVNFKTNVPSYKSKRRMRNSPERMEVIPDTHEAIIDKELWEKVQEVLQNGKQEKNRVVPIPERTPLAGYVYCADCGAPMLNNRARSHPRKDKNGRHTGGKTKPLDLFECRSYVNSQRKRQVVCTRHTVHSAALEELTLTALRQIVQQALRDEAAFLDRIQAENQTLWDSEHRQEQIKCRREKQRRCAELDRLIQGAYEANFKGNMTDGRLKLLVDGYEAEQETLTQEIAVLEEQERQWQAEQKDGKAFLTRLKQAGAFPALTPEVCSLFLEKIVVHEREGQGQEMTQKVEIYFKCIGKVGTDDG